jgi:gamma-glutamyltranspeptidase / glutathione hydrolase
VSRTTANAVVCPEPPAAQVAAQALQGGATIADAAIAAAFAQAVTNPLGSGIGGMAHILLLPAGAPAISINATVEMGSHASTGAFEQAFRGRSERAGRYLVEGDHNQFGYRSIMTPGFVRGLESLHRLGSSKLAWSSLVEPAAALAEDGFPVYPYLHHYYGLEGPSRAGYPGIERKLEGQPQLQRIYFPGGEPLPIHAQLRQTEYGETLRTISEQGPDEFYRGEVARRASDDLAANGSFVTSDDLATYEARIEEPLSASFRDVTVYSAPPPSHGLILLMMLRLVEPISLESMTLNDPDYVELIAWATRTAFEASLPYLGDPHFVSVPTQWLLSDEHISAARSAAPNPNAQAGVLPGGNTTHLSAASSDGTLISMTHSIGSITGAGVATPKLGFLYNNFVGQFNVLRGYHDSIAPKKRMGGGCPSILFRSGKPWMAIGSSGGPRLFSAVFQTILNAVIFQMPLAEAVTVPRVHSEQPGRIYVEPSLQKATSDALTSRGYEIVVTDYMGCNQAVAYTAGGIEAGTDPRGGQGIGADFELCLAGEDR